MGSPLDRITLRLNNVKRSVKRLFIIDGISRLLMFIGLFLAATFLLDWSLDLPKEIRIIFLFAGVVVLILILVRYVVYPTTVKITDDDLAIMIEEKHPQLEEGLISAIQLSREVASDGKYNCFNSPTLIGAVVDSATQSSENINFDSIIVRRNVFNISCIAIFIIFTFIAFASYCNNYSAIYFSRLIGGGTKWPQQTYLSIEDFKEQKKIVAKGDDLIITAIAKGKIPKRASIYYKFDTGENGKDSMKAINLIEGRFEYVFPKVMGPLNFHVEGGDDVTAIHYVYTLTPPTVENITYLLGYPKYTGLTNTSPDKPEEGGNIRAPIGTKVAIKGLCNEEIESAQLTISTNSKDSSTDDKTTTMKLFPDANGKDKIISGEFYVVNMSSEYTITLKAKNGLSNRDPIRYTIKGVVDNGPMISVKDPTTDEYLTDIAVRPLAIETADDYGILEIALSRKVISQTNATEQVTVFGSQENTPLEYGGKFIKTKYALDVSKLNVKQGDVVEYYYRATDNAERIQTDEGSAVEHNVTKTKSYRFWIVSVSELEKRLAADIESIKNELRIQKKNEEFLRQRVINIGRKYGKVDEFTQEQRAEVKSTELDQNQIGQKLEGMVRKIDIVLKQGVYNKIFDEKSSQKLEGVKSILSEIIDSPADRSKVGKSSAASMLISSAYKSKNGGERADTIGRAERIQDDIVLDLTSALALLEEWATYQEVVRITREILEAQKNVNKGIKPE
ncbi:MAG: hypothetical protein A2W05_01795 [Candidatus Schekmanbacteria bacterium RBG_16_38_10]|uniref:DUF4175 domain-containing protein n=1 Tax=Candidatus Schekmanbacteria bacterium RBG_16_38_10 TaxID=1817879 RepID=A0A1F7RX38_9BACT|nr:MAG: hypothetical protein A2W05_01795 [Candidatus Schekmanbacteria bacterium RBG_16_38_10]